jgi:hypothetical protein
VPGPGRRDRQQEPPAARDGARNPEDQQKAAGAGDVQPSADPRGAGVRLPSGRNRKQGRRHCDRQDSRGDALPQRGSSVSHHAGIDRMLSCGELDV